MSESPSCHCHDGASTLSNDSLLRASKTSTTPMTAHRRQPCGVGGGYVTLPSKTVKFGERSLILARKPFPLEFTTGHSAGGHLPRIVRDNVICAFI